MRSPHRPHPAEDGPTPAALEAGRKYVCTNPDCDPYVYDPARGDVDNINGGGTAIPPGTSFAGLPHDWLCPYCGSGKDWFRPLT